MVCLIVDKCAVSKLLTSCWISLAIRNGVVDSVRLTPAGREDTSKPEARASPHGFQATVDYATLGCMIFNALADAAANPGSIKQAESFGTLGSTNGICPKFGI